MNYSDKEKRTKPTITPTVVANIIYVLSGFKSCPFYYPKLVYKHIFCTHIHPYKVDKDTFGTVIYSFEFYSQPALQKGFDIYRFFNFSNSSILIMSMTLWVMVSLLIIAFA